jgi:hypothetical protein
MLKSIWKAIQLAFCLTALISLASTYAIGAPSVLVIAPPSTNSQTATWKLMTCSEAGSKRIADLSQNTLFGSDDSVVALVELSDDSAKPNRLLVIDRQTFAIITNITIIGGDSPPGRMLQVENLVSVQSTNYTVYFPTYDYVGHHGFGFAEINWKTGKVRQFPASRPQDNLAGDIVCLISIPSGFAVSGFLNTIDLYDATTQKKVLMLREEGNDYSWQFRRMYYVPTIGLMEYYDGEHRQLTDTNLLAATTNAEHFPSEKFESEVFVRNKDGKPFLIWGENKGKQDPRMPETTINEIVVFDVGLKKEVLRKPLGGSFSENILPNQNGTRIYFTQSQTGEIFYLDCESQTISSFARTSLQGYNRWDPTIVDAN